MLVNLEPRCDLLNQSAPICKSLLLAAAPRVPRLARVQFAGDYVVAFGRGVAAWNRWVRVRNGNTGMGIQFLCLPASLVRDAQSCDVFPNNDGSVVMVAAMKKRLGL